jgi:hypothetical protein
VENPENTLLDTHSSFICHSVSDEVVFTLGTFGAKLSSKLLKVAKESSEEV